MIPVVGLGGSAGSIAALQAFFQAMPADSGMAFVIVVHLAPDRESALTPLLQSVTRMRVASATNGIAAAANHVYVIPPGKLLTITDGHLHLVELEPERGRRVAVDLFFRSLADTHGSRSIAIVLSGADGDGAIGIKRIKERGGLTIAQDPGEAQYPGMPRSAIGTGMVDWVLSISQMPGRLLAYRKDEHTLLPSPEGLQPSPSTRTPPLDAEAGLREALAFLHSRTGRDFSCYKPATILRRISRRMQVNGVDTLSSYLDYLREHAAEVSSLLQELLISVTNFFRDPECFAALHARLPELFKHAKRTDTKRVWVVACATGEEAYSLAILLDEFARTLPEPPALQLFATDLAEGALQIAREGLYPETIVADVSEERLRRYFVKEHRGYRVRREIRETVLFAHHDVLKDSPFSRLDLVSCRNLLIYLDREAQTRALDIFNFALRPSGLLFLGSSESADDDGELFDVVDKRNRIFAPKASPRTGYPVPRGLGTLARSSLPPAAVRLTPPAATGELIQSRQLNPGDPLAASWSELHFQLLERFAAPSVLVNHDYDIVHLSEKVGQFLQFSGGEPTRNLLRVVHPVMRIELRAALYRAAQPDAPTQTFSTELELDGARCLVEVRITAATAVAPKFFLVLFEPQGVAPRNPPLTEALPEPIARQLEREIEKLKSHLRDVIEQSDASSEELKASNEELQAMNEEMRSATEELETGREELQSINEELTTVNQELKHKVDELGRTNSDLQNLIAATSIATVFLDRDLRITRYTPTAVTLFNFIPTDVGRPLSDLARQRDYGTILDDAARALSQLTLAERELQLDARWFLARILPYRTTEDHIAGVVLTFFDISERKRADDALRRAGEELDSRVQQRTAELAMANESLRAEVIQRVRAQEERQVMVRQLMTAQEQERARISRGLHDEVGQTLASLLLDLKTLQMERDRQATRERLRAMTQVVENLSRQSHELAVELRPTALDDLGLPLALSHYVERWSVRTGIASEFNSSGLDSTRLPNLVETCIYRIVAEALTNVLKHSRATRVSVLVQRRAGQAVAFVEDNGIGFQPSAALPGNKLGLLGMQERAALLNGEVTVESGAESGTSVYVRIPIADQSAEDALR